MRRHLIALLLVGASAATAAVVRADSFTVDDRVEGYAVDAVSAKHHHFRIAPDVIAHTIRMSGEWSSSQMPGLQMKLKLIGADSTVTRRLFLTPERDGSLRGIAESRGRFLGFVYGWRPSSAAVRIEFPRALVRGADAYRWSAKIVQPCTADTGSCAIEWDRVPDAGTILHELNR